MMKLLSATPSPYARKVRIALAEKGLPFELLTEVPWNADTSTPKYNPLEKLPVLILDDGSTVYESRFILEWLETKRPEPPLLPPDPDDRLAAKRLEVLVDGICDAFVLFFFERMRPEAQRSQPWMDRQLRKIHGGFREVARLTPSQGFCVAGRFTLGDIAVGTLLDFITVRFPEFDWRSEHPHLASYLAGVSQRPSFQGSKPVPQQIDRAVV
jgi:glutathione S-transferase